MVLPGFNTDFKYKGQVYHAQTEDNGTSNPVVVTLLYLKGAILSSKKTNYKDLLEKNSYQKELMDLMKSQHREMMRSVLAGNFDTPSEHKTAQPAAAPPPVEEPAPPPQAVRASSGPRDLDAYIVEYLDRFAAGRPSSL